MTKSNSKAPERNPEDYDLVTSEPFKLKDKPQRQYQMIDLVKQFGKVPEVIIVEKVKGMNNTLVVKAFVKKDIIL